MTSSNPIPSSGPSPRPPLDWVREAGKVNLVLEDIAAKLARKRRRRARAVTVLASAALIALAAVWAVPVWRQTNTVQTLPAQRQSVALFDGSTAELNARTDLHTDFRYGRRTVRMTSGEAFFSVAKDPVHPFLVVTPAGTIRVTGTHFNVRITADQRPEVTLLEGAVAVEGVAPEPVRLLPGQRFFASGTVTTTAAMVSTLAPADLEAATAWRQGRLVLDHLTLAEAAARFAAYHGKGIAVAAEIEGLRMGGSCSLDDLSGFLEFLGKALAVEVQAGSDGSFRIHAR